MVLLLLFIVVIPLVFQQQRTTKTPFFLQTPVLLFLSMVPFLFLLLPFFVIAVMLLLLCYWCCHFCYCCFCLCYWCWYLFSSLLMYVVIVVIIVLDIVTLRIQWQLPEMHHLLRAAGATTHTFNQRIHGQISIKPTTLYALRLPTLPRYLCKPQLDIGQNSQMLEKLGGKRTMITADGRTTTDFRTARAKEYPPSMCIAIAISMLDSLNAPLPHGCQQASVPQSLIDLCTRMQQPHDPYSDIHDMKADCMMYNQEH